MSPNQFVAAIGLQDEYAPIVAAMAHQPLEQYLPIKDQKGEPHFSITQQELVLLPIEQQLLHALFLVPKAIRKTQRRHRDELESDGVSKLWVLLSTDLRPANVEAYLFTCLKNHLGKVCSFLENPSRRHPDTPAEPGRRRLIIDTRTCSELESVPHPTSNPLEEAMQNEEHDYWNEHEDDIEYVRSEIEGLLHSPSAGHEFRREVHETLSSLEGLLGTLGITTEQAKREVSRHRKKLRDRRTPLTM